MSLFNKIIVLTIPFVPKFIVYLFAKNYVAGSKMEHALKTVRELNKKGIMATIDLLGEEIKNLEEAKQAAEIYKEVLAAIDKEKLDANISVKPTHMGLKLDKDFCYENIRSIVIEAVKYNNFVRIDMEDHTTTDATIEIYLKIKEEFNNNVGTVLQSYMRRLIDDINYLIPDKANIRLCKGIYVEPYSVAFKEHRIVNNNYSYGLEKLLSNKCYVGIATHDEELVWSGLKLIDQLGLKKEEYEFQMLLGVRENLRDIILSQGHRLRVYVPFGKSWHAYLVRRLKENPNVATNGLKNLFGMK